MKFLLIGLAVVLFSTGALADGRIIDGVAIPISKAKYTMQMRTKHDITVCGGTLVGKRHVVTAAHCLVKYPDNGGIFWVGGATTVNERGVKRGVVQRFVHENYTALNNANDVAVMKLDGDMEGTDIAVIPLSSTRLQKGNQLQVSGWGRTTASGNSSDNLLTVFVTIISQDECKDMYKKKKFSIKVDDSHVCAYDNGVKDSCRGDSGGPGVYENKLSGIVSWGKGCGVVGYPGMYTSVESVRGFIEDSMKK